MAAYRDPVTGEVTGSGDGIYGEGGNAMTRALGQSGSPFSVGGGSSRGMFGGMGAGGTSGQGVQRTATNAPGTYYGNNPNAWNRVQSAQQGWRDATKATLGGNGRAAYDFLANMGRGTMQQRAAQLRAQYPGGTGMGPDVNRAGFSNPANFGTGAQLPGSQGSTGGGIYSGGNAMVGGAPSQSISQAMGALNFSGDNIPTAAYQAQQLMQQNGWTVDQVAQAMGYSPADIQAVLNKAQTPQTGMYSGGNAMTAAYGGPKRVVF